MSQFERPNIRKMQGYTWGEQPRDDGVIKLNTNENPYPPSPAVDAVFQQLTPGDLRRYPQPTADPLRAAIADLHGVSRDQIVVTNGGDEALRLAFTTFVEPGARFGMAEPSYSLYPVIAAIHGAETIRIELSDEWKLPVDASARLNGAGVQLACIVNPHAPSGQLMSSDQLGALATALDGVLLIDEAYADFIDPTHGYDSRHLISEYDNVLILRSFSKGYSLAGLRLGYLLGSIDLIEPIVTKTRDSYNVNHLSQVIGRVAFEDQTHARETWSKVRAQRSSLAARLGDLGLHAPSSEANFLLVSVPESCGHTAQSLYAGLKQAGVLVRYFDTPRLDDKLRITVGTEEENDRLITELARMLD